MLRQGKSAIHGQGLFANCFIGSGTVLGDYSDDDSLIDDYVAWLSDRTRPKRRRRRCKFDPNVALREQLAFSQYGGRVTFPDLFEPFCKDLFGKDWKRVRRYMVMLGSKTVDVRGEELDVPIILLGHDTLLGKANSSDAPNARLTDRGQLVTIRDVEEGDEITWAYDIVGSRDLPVEN